MQQVPQFADNCLRSLPDTQTCRISAKEPTEWSCKYDGRSWAIPERHSIGDNMELLIGAPTRERCGLVKCTGMLSLRMYLYNQVDDRHLIIMERGTVLTGGI